MKNWNYINGAQIGNAGITDKEFKSESELRRWCMDHNYTYTPVGGGYYRLEDDSGKNRRDMEAHVSSETGNSTEKLFEGLKKDAEEKEKEKTESIEELEKVGNELKVDPADKASKPEPRKNPFPFSKKKEEKEDEPKKPFAKFLEETRKADAEKVKNASSFIDTAKKELEKTKANLSKTGNSAPDDKFAYVMREFDEGKLKTPDGKVVTDPAQAKAIAYSESKKTENGFSRATNAMKKNS